MTLLYAAWSRLLSWATGQYLIYSIDRAVRRDPLLRRLGVMFPRAGRRQFVSEYSGLRAHWVMRGSAVPPSSLRRDLIEIPADWIGFHVFESSDSFVERRVILREMAVERVRAEVVTRVFALMAASQPRLTGDLRHAWASIQGEVVGSPEALSRMDLSGDLRGVRPIVIDLRDADDQRVLPDDRVFIVSPRASRFVIWPHPSSKVYNEEDGFYTHLVMRWQFGGVIHQPGGLITVIPSVGARMDEERRRQAQSQAS